MCSEVSNNILVKFETIVSLHSSVGRALDCRRIAFIELSLVRFRLWRSFFMAKCNAMASYYTINIVFSHAFLHLHRKTVLRTRKKWTKKISKNLTENQLFACCANTLVVLGFFHFGLLSPYRNIGAHTETAPTGS